MGIWLMLLINVTTLPLNVISFQKQSDFLAHPVLVPPKTGYGKF